MDSEETMNIFAGTGKEPNPPQFLNSRGRRENWKNKLKGFEEGDIFQWNLSGWQTVNKNYVTDEVMISLKLEKKEHWIVLLRSAVINQIVGLARQEILVEKFKKCAHNRT